MRWIKIFKTGTHTDSNGKVRDYTEQDLDKMVSNYTNRTEDAPLVLGHPKTADPAFGWVKKVRRIGENLCAQFAQVPDKLKKAVDNGEYKYVSLSHTPDLHIRHVGLLGAANPGVQGLGPVSFADGDGSVAVDIDFSGPPSTPTREDSMELLAKIKELEDQIAALKAELDKSQNDKKEAEAELEKTKSEFAAAATRRRAEQLENRIDELVNSGKLLPADKDETLAYCAALDNGTEVSFCAADGKKTLVDHFLDRIAKGADTGLLHEFSAPVEKNKDDDFDASDLAQKF